MSEDKSIKEYFKMEKSRIHFLEQGKCIQFSEMW